MDKEPLISVIIPVYNVEKYLRKCVESVISQSYSNLEIILIDDGSTDSSGEMCDEFQKKDPRIEVIHKENGGLSSARNAGLDRINGEFISFIDSDDFVSESYIEELYKQLSEDGSDIAISGFTTCDEEGNAIKICSSRRKCRIDETGFWEWIILGNSDNILYGAVEAWSKLYRSGIFRNLRFPITIHEDEAVLFDVIHNSSFISVSDQADYYYTQRNNSIMHQKYSIETMKTAGIFTERSERLFHEGFQRFAECTLLNAAEKIIEGMDNLPDTMDEKKQVELSLMKEFSRVGKLIRSNSKSLKFRIKALIFAISPKIFAMLF